MELGTRLKEKRKELGLTQRQVADIIGVSINTVYNWEKGSKIGEDNLSAVEDFIRDDEIFSPPEPAEDPTLQETQPEEPAPEPTPEPDPEPALPPLFKYMVIMKEGPEIKVTAEAASIMIKPEIKLLAFTTQGRRVAMFRMDDITGFYEDMEIER